MTASPFWKKPIPAASSPWKKRSRMPSPACHFRPMRNHPPSARGQLIRRFIKSLLLERQRQGRAGGHLHGNVAKARALLNFFGQALANDEFNRGLGDGDLGLVHAG